MVVRRLTKRQKEKVLYIVHGREHASAAYRAVGGVKQIVSCCSGWSSVKQP